VLALTPSNHGWIRGDVLKETINAILKIAYNSTIFVAFVKKGSKKQSPRRMSRGELCETIIGRGRKKQIRDLPLLSSAEEKNAK